MSPRACPRASPLCSLSAGERGRPPPGSLLCTLPTFSDKPAARPAVPFSGDFMRSCATQKCPAPSEAP